MSLKNLVGGLQGCDPNQGTIANPLTRFVDCALQDPLRMQQLQEGYRHTKMMGPPQGGNPMMPSNMGPMINRPLKENPMLPMSNDLYREAGGASFSPMPNANLVTAPPPASSWAQDFQMENRMMNPSSSSQQMPQANPHMMNNTHFNPSPMMYSSGMPMMMNGPAFMGGMNMPYMPSYPSMYSSPMMPMMQRGVERREEKKTEEKKEQNAQERPVEERTKEPETDGKNLAADLLKKLQETNNPDIINSDFAKFCQQISNGEINLANVEVTMNSNETHEVAAPSSADGVFEEYARFQEELGTKYAGINEEVSQKLKDLNEHNYEEFLESLDDIIDGKADSILSQEILKDNPYLSLSENDMENKANELLNGRNPYELRRVLEAAIVSPNTVDNKNFYWRQLGCLHADQDRDIEAIMCLRRAYEEDPYDVDAMLALGVSLVNELDTSQAIDLLCKWISVHPEYSDLHRSEDKSIDYVKTLYEQALQRNQEDCDIHIALGVLCNITRDTQQAIHHLMKACQLKPHLHQSWNKLGATLANSQHHTIAIMAYQQALALNPQYTRGWNNLAIAHANIGLHEEALKFYCLAGSLTPEANHIWHYIHGTLLTLGDYTLLDYLDQRNMRGLMDGLKNVIYAEQLPEGIKDEGEVRRTSEEVMSKLRAAVDNAFQRERTNSDGVDISA